MSNTWLGKNAVLWALDEAPGLPANLVATLIALARYADQDGRSAHPSASTIATHTRKTERQAKRDLAALRQLGLIRRGNQRIVSSIRKDQRPIVYDLAMPPRGDTHDTPPARNGVTYRAARGDIQSHHGVSPMSPKEIRNTSGIGERDAESAPTPLAGADPAHISATVDQLRRELTANRRPSTCTDSDMQDVTRELAAIDAALDAFVLDGTPLA